MLVLVMASTKEKAVASGSGSRKASGGGSSAKKSSGSWIPAELFQVGSYKPTQGRTVRLVTAMTFGVICALSAWRLYDTLATVRLSENPESALNVLRWVVPAVLLFGGAWLSWRVVNLPKFADFLIAVEAEMTKVSWPTNTELYRSSLVVIFFIVSLAAILFAFDVFWKFFFSKVLGIMS